MPKKRPAPNRYWIYSNTNYLLLGELVQKVTGHPLAEEIRTRLLDPLDLDTAWYQAVEQPRADGAVGYRTVVTADGRTRFVPVAPASDVMPFRSVVTAAGGAGSIAATALDTARWMRAWAGGEPAVALARGAGPRRHGADPQAPLPDPVRAGHPGGAHRRAATRWATPGDTWGSATSRATCPARA